MNNLIKNLIRKGREISLTKIEKAEIRQRLLAFMRGGEAMQRVAAPASWTARILKPVFASAMTTVLLGGGVSFASQNTLPGDLLYPVKINVTEKVRAALTVSAQAKAEWETTLAERRLEEAEKLAAEGNLNDDQKAQSEKRFAEHAERAKEKIAALEARADLKAAAEVSGRLEGSLKAHKKILKRLKNVESVAAAVNAQSSGSAMMRAAVMEMNTKVDASEESDLSRTKNESSDAQEERVLLKARQQLNVEVNTGEDSEKDEVVEINATVQSGLKIGL